MTKYNRGKCTSYDVYVEIIVERKIKVVAIDKEEAVDLGLERIKTRTKSLERPDNQKILSYEPVDVVEKTTSS